MALRKPIPSAWHEKPGLSNMKVLRHESDDHIRYVNIQLPCWETIVFIMEQHPGKTCLLSYHPDEAWRLQVSPPGFVFEGLRPRNLEHWFTAHPHLKAKGLSTSYINSIGGPRIGKRGKLAQQCVVSYECEISDREALVVSDLKSLPEKIWSMYGYAVDGAARLRLVACKGVLPEPSAESGGEPEGKRTKRMAIPRTSQFIVLK